jgi:DNA repair protein RadC
MCPIYLKYAQLIDVLKLIDIKLPDHLIISENEYASLIEKGFL